MGADAGQEHREPPAAARYLVALTLPVTIVLVTQALRHWVVPEAAPAFSVAVAIAAVYGGWGPGALASVLSLAGFVFFPDLLAGSLGATRLVQFLLVSGVITWTGGAAYRERWRAVGQARENEGLRRLAEQATTLAQGNAKRAESAAVEAEVALTARTEVEATLRARERSLGELYENTARFAAIVASSSDAIISKTLDGTITSWNPAAEHIFGYSAQEMVGASVFKLIPEELHPSERDVLTRLSQGEMVAVAETERIRKDGRRIWISLSVSPVRDNAGKIIGAASIKRDVTERKIAEDRLRDTQRLRAVGQLAGGVAHEANNQMLVVLGAVHFLLRQGDLPSAAQNDLMEIRQAAERTAAITQQLLAFGRRQVLKLENVDVNRIVSRFEPVLRRTLAEHHELSLELSTDELMVRVDPQQLDQVLLNLTLNARDAMPDGGCLTIRTVPGWIDAAGNATATQPADGSAARYAGLVVEDTGYGMDAATLQRALEPFFTTKGVGQGTGLGLSVVEGIVSQSGGFVRITSAPGKGATFSAYFPLVQGSAPAGPIAAQERLPAGNGRGLLVVEDELTVRATAVRALKDAGYAVREASHGREALDILEQRSARVDLVITDLGMPVMDGHELARRLRVAQPDLPILFISGYADSGTVTPYLQKPFSPDELVRRVGMVLAAANRPGTS
jgi:two-component system, cell cycle sensor histidine kinase and response regulator CckA